MKNKKSQDDYATVRIPRELANEIDKIVESGTLGYRTRAEMVNEAIRLRIEILRFNNSIRSKTPEKREKE